MSNTNIIHQSKNGIALVDGFYWVANLQKKYLSMVYIQNKENMVRIFGVDTKMTVQNLVNLEKMNGVEILDIVAVPKKVQNYKFSDNLPKK